MIREYNRVCLPETVKHMYYGLYVKGWRLKEDIRETLTSEDGMGAVEVVLITVVLIALVLLFKNTVVSIVKSALSKASKDAGTIQK